MPFAGFRCIKRPETAGFDKVQNPCLAVAPITALPVLFHQTVHPQSRKGSVASWAFLMWGENHFKDDPVVGGHHHTGIIGSKRGRGFLIGIS